jgi:hypothetical protein
MKRIAVWKRRRMPVTKILLVASSVFAIWLAWHFRGLIHPWMWALEVIHMSVLTFLRIAAYGAIPIAMAWGGGHLAAMAFDDATDRRRWRLGFILLAVFGIAVVTIVEVKVDMEHKAEQLSVAQLLSTMSGNILRPPINPEHQDMVSRLDAIREKLKVPSVARIIIQRPPFPGAPLTTEERFKAMTNSELRDYALQWTNKLRDFEKNYEGIEYSNAAQFRWPVDPALRSQAMQDNIARTVQLSRDHENEFQKYYWGETRSLHAEIKNRFEARGGKVPTPGEVLPSLFLPLGGALILETISNGKLSGPSPLQGVANYLEILARALPAH